MPDIVLQQSKEKQWIRYTKQRIKKNKNAMYFIGGPTGSGKTFCSLRIAEELDPEFDIDRVVFNGVELMDLINSGKLRKGSVVVFEEAGIEMSNKNWQSTINKMLNYLIQTFRHRNFILIFNSPYMDFVDASTRKLFHAELITMGIDFNKNQVRLKPQMLQYNARNKKFYYKYLRVITQNGVLPIKVWRVDKPSSSLLKEYEKKKSAFTTQLNKKIYEELKNANEKNKKTKKIKCMKCNYKWFPRGNEQPKRCPQCHKNPY